MLCIREAQGTERRAQGKNNKERSAGRGAEGKRKKEAQTEDNDRRRSAGGTGLIGQGRDKG